MTSARSLQRMIHVGCKQLGLDEDARRGLQLITTGKTSMSDMTEPELRRMVEALKKRGFKPFGNSYFKGGKTAGGKARPPAPRADLRFVHVLWKLLGEAGALKRPGRDGLNAFIRSRFEGKWQSVPIDVDALRDAGQINDVTRALKDMCRRAGMVIR
ncbi:regulatory protein GemA [Paracoccus denitrificans]|uniref:gp16 family protein n=1 Tax=Paracoccus denitrificans TaxID=266 RepID=UPI001E418E75|nr:regulatory protein GemA [Paracoccus denitrificans]UFS63820.1 regulatory protein GemA [Paracoccus denitrificans]